MLRYLPLLLMAACAVDKSSAEPPSTAAARTTDTALPVPKAPDPVPVPTPPAPPPPAADGALVLAVGEQAPVAPKATLHFDRLVDDSRCPANVQCIWAGEVRIALTLSVAGSPETFELASAREDSKTVQGFEFKLLEYGPCPLGHGAPAQECASLKVTPPG